MGNNLSFLLMELRIQNSVRNAFFSQTIADFFRAFDGNCTNQYRLSLLMCLNAFFDNGIDLLSVCTEYKIIMIHTNNLLIRRDLDNIQTINLTELFLFCQSSTCHTCRLVVFIKEVLQCDRCQRTAFTLHFHAFLCLNCLMQTVRITSARHNTTCKFINDQNLAVLDHIVLITEHQIIGTKRQCHNMLDLKIFGVCKVVQMEVILYLLDTLFCQDNMLLFLVDNEITGLFYFIAHHDCHLVNLALTFALCHTFGQIITCAVKCR